MSLTKDFEFSSERLRYRGISADDAELIVAWRSDPVNYRHFFDARPITLEEHLDWFEGYLDDLSRYDFMIIDGEGNRVGTVGLSHVVDAGGTCEVSYMIGEKSARGKGYATEAVRAIIDLAFNELDASAVDARIRSGNEVSVKVALRGGLSEYERVFRIERDDLICDGKARRGFE